MSEKEVPAAAGSETLDEAGYQAVISACDDPAEATQRMMVFIRRIVAENDGKVMDEGGLSGFAPFYSGEKAVQSYARLVEELREQSREGGWLLLPRVGRDLRQTAASLQPLTENGYQIVASRKSHEEMKAFIEKLIASLGGVVLDDGGFQGFVPFYSGEKTVQSLAQLRAELSNIMRKEDSWVQRRDSQADIEDPRFAARVQWQWQDQRIFNIPGTRGIARRWGVCWSEPVRPSDLIRQWKDAQLDTADPDSEVAQKAVQLRKVGDESTCREFSSITHAIAWLESVQSVVSEEEASALRTLQSTFKQRDIKELKDALRECGGDAQLASRLLLSRPPDLKTMPKQFFRYFDLDGNGVLKLDEMQEAVLNSDIGSHVDRQYVTTAVCNFYSEVESIDVEQFEAPGGFKDIVLANLDFEADSDDGEDPYDEEAALNFDLPSDLDMGQLAEDGILGLFFSAKLCGPWRSSAAMLRRRYFTYKQAELPFEVLFVSADCSESAYEQHVRPMPWPKLPYASKRARRILASKLEVKSVPCLVLLSASGSFSANGLQLLEEDDTGDAFPWGLTEVADPLSSSRDEEVTPADAFSTMLKAVLDRKKKASSQIAQQKNLEVRALDVALTTSLTEEGYSKVADFQSNYAMKAFAQRVLDVKHCTVTDQAAFSALMWDYSGVNGRQSLEQLLKDLEYSTWVQKQEAGSPTSPSRPLPPVPAAEEADHPPTSKDEEGPPEEKAGAADSGETAESSRPSPGKGPPPPQSGKAGGKGPPAPTGKGPPAPAGKGPPAPTGKDTPAPADKEPEKVPTAPSGKGKGPPLPASTGKGPPLPASSGKGPPIPTIPPTSGKGPPLPSTGKGPPLPTAGGKGPPLPSTGKGPPLPTAGGKGPPLPSGKGPPVPSSGGKGPPAPAGKGPAIGKGGKGKDSGPTRPEKSEWVGKTDTVLRWKRTLKSSNYWKGCLFDKHDELPINGERLQECFNSRQSPKKKESVDATAALAKKKDILWMPTEKDSSGRRRQNLAILTKVLEKQAASFFDRLQVFDFEAIQKDASLDKELLEQFVHTVDTVTDEEWKRLTQADAEECFEWDDAVEGMFCRVHRVPQFKQRFQAVLLHWQIERALPLLSQQLADMSSGIGAIRGSEVLQDTFLKVLHIGNCLNAGNSTFGRADGFDTIILLQKYLLIDQPKGVDNISLLHYVRDNELEEEQRFAFHDLASVLKGWEVPKSEEDEDATSVLQLRGEIGLLGRVLGELESMLDAARAKCITAETTPDGGSPSPDGQQPVASAPSGGSPGGPQEPKQQPTEAVATVGGGAAGPLSLPFQETALPSNLGKLSAFASALKKHRADIDALDCKLGSLSDQLQELRVWLTWSSTKDLSAALLLGCVAELARRLALEQRRRPHRRSAQGRIARAAPPSSS